MTPAGRRRLPLRLAPAAIGLLVVLAACSSDKAAAPTSAPTTASRLTEITGPIPAPTVTVPVVTQPVPAASTAPTSPPLTTPPAPDPGTTTTAGPSCDAGTLFAVLKAAIDLPPDTGAQEPACAPQWATMVVGAPGQERNLAVFTWEGGTTWRLADIGTEGVCTGAKVPANLFDALGCPAWES